MCDKQNDCCKKIKNCHHHHHHHHRNEHKSDKCDELNLKITDVTLNLDSLQLSLIIFGENLTLVDKIIVNNFTINTFTIIDNTKIIVNVPSSDNKNLSITLKRDEITTLEASLTNCRNAFTSNNFNYVLPDAPTITYISPASGGTSPILNITIFGTNLSLTRTIKYGAYTLSVLNYPVSITSDTLISFIAPVTITTEPTNIPISVTTFSGTSNTVVYLAIPPPII